MLGRAPHNKEECSTHDHSLSDDAVDHVRSLVCLALDSRLPLDQTCIIVPITQRRTNVFSLKMFAPPDRYVEALRNIGVVFDMTDETRRMLQSEYEYSSVLGHAQSLLKFHREGAAVKCKLGSQNFFRAPDASCSSVLLWGDIEKPDALALVELADKVQFYDRMAARMQGEFVGRVSFDFEALSLNPPA